MRKVSLLCLLGLITTAPTVSFAADAATVVSADAITVVMKSDGNKYLKSGKSDAKAFIKELQKKGGNITLEDVLKLCPQYLKSDEEVSEEQKLDYCKEFGELVIAENNRIAKQEMIAKKLEPVDFSPKWSPVNPDGTPEKGAYDSKYYMKQTGYGFGVFNRKGKIQCILGDDPHTSKCDTHKACYNVDSGRIFVCGGENNSDASYSFITVCDDEKKNSEEAKLWRKYVDQAESLEQQLERLNTPVPLVELPKIEKRELKLQSAEKEEIAKLPCRSGMIYPTEEQAGCSNGQCKMNPNLCYTPEQIACQEAANKGEATEWAVVGKDKIGMNVMGCKCTDSKKTEWDAEAKVCKEKPKKTCAEVWGEGTEAFYCCKANAKWDSKTQVCTCRDPKKTGAMVWLDHKCVENPEKVNCMKFVDVGQAIWNDELKSCKCTNTGMQWNGETCTKNANQCLDIANSKHTKTVSIPESSLVYVNKDATFYKGLVANVNKFNAALAKAQQGTSTKADCDIVRTLDAKIDSDNTILSNIDKNVNTFKTFNKDGIQFWTTTPGKDGTPKQLTNENEMENDAKYQMWYTIKNTNGAASRMFTGTVSGAMADEAHKALISYFGNAPTCRNQGRSRLVKCSVNTSGQRSDVIMTFRYALFTDGEKEQIKQIAQVLGEVEKRLNPITGPYYVSRDLFTAANNWWDGLTYEQKKQVAMFGIATATGFYPVAATGLATYATAKAFANFWNGMSDNQKRMFVSAGLLGPGLANPGTATLIVSATSLYFMKEGTEVVLANFS